MTNKAVNEKLDELIQVGALFESRQWFLGTSGNFSVLVVKEPLSFAITASGIDKGKVSRNSFVIINADGKQVLEAHQQGNLRPSDEWPIHSFIYQKNDAQCVIHVHTVPVLLVTELCGQEGHVQIQGLEVLKGLGCKSASQSLKVPIVDNKDDPTDLARAVAGCIEKSNGLIAPAVLVKRHGIFAWGSSVFAAKRHVELLMHAFEYFVQKRRLGI